MSEHLPHKSTVLPRDVVVIDDQGEKRLYLLKCSRRKLEGLLEAAIRSRSIQTG